VTREEALAALASLSAVTRLQAARKLFSLATSEDLAVVSERLSNEKDAYVQRALARVCLHLGNNLPASENASSEKLVDSVLREEIRTQVVEEMSKVISHELQSTVGFLDVHAKADVGDAYEQSRTHDDVQRLIEFLGVLGHLNDAARPAAYQELDLGDVIARSLRAAHIPSERTLLGTTETVVVRGDPRLLKLALTNVLLNAIQACEETSGRVTVNWGTTDRDSWITVWDEGSGLKQGYDASTRPGTTTKPGHFGWGLTIVLRALASMGSGQFDLRPRSGGGAEAELRWPHLTD
jgi:signal transduction histidine kinase